MPSLGGSGEYGGDDVSGGASRGSSNNGDSGSDNVSRAYQEAANSMKSAGVQNLAGKGTSAYDRAVAAASSGDNGFMGTTMSKKPSDLDYGIGDFFADLAETAVGAFTMGFVDPEFTGKSFSLFDGIVDEETGVRLDPVTGLATVVGGPVLGTLAGEVVERLDYDPTYNVDLDFSSSGVAALEPDSRDYPQGNDGSDGPTRVTNVTKSATKQNSNAEKKPDVDALEQLLAGFAYSPQPDFKLLSPIETKLMNKA